MKKLLIIEDDISLAQELMVLLEKNGYAAEYISDFDNIVEQMILAHADMILLDINLPAADGQNILKQFRKESDTPVIMVTSRDTEMDELISMSFGADDYITKPYNPSILLLHIEAVFKRLGRNETEARLIYNGLCLDVNRAIMSRGDLELELSKNEMAILTYMINNQGRIISRDELIGYLWDSEEFVDDNTLNVNINRVRKKLSDMGLSDAIRTKRGQGYMLI